MDFGVVSHKQTSPNAACLGSTEVEKGHGSMNLKHQRSGLSEDSWRLPKMLRPGEVDFSSSKATESFAAFGRSNLWPSSAVDDGQKMLSFSSAVPHGGGGGGSSKSIAFSSCHDEHLRRGGGGGLNGGLRGPFARMRGPFTPSQWMELEHQALIYKHLVANVPIPSNLLIPLKRSLYSYGSPQSYASNFLGWGPFHLGFSGSNDPEPGRCRRTDGKKWRCSRDAVPDQKYCERHINRGRHRSRKPVEAQSGHAIAVSRIRSTTNTTSKVVPPIASSSSSSASMMSSNSLGALHHQFTNTASTSTDHLVNRSQVYQGLSLITPIQKQHVPFEESSHSEFGIVTSDSLLNPTERISYINTNNNQNPVHHFIDDWPKDHLELKSDWTQLSMSIPVAPDFQSPSSSPAQEKSSISALRLSHELDPIHMSLGVSHHHDLGEPKQQSQSSSSWLPVNWGNSMGGPLGEVLSSHQVGSSPTGVLQRSTFVSLSNSSSGSSPRSMDNKNKVSENGGFCNDLLGSAAAAAARVTSAAIPSL